MSLGVRDTRESPALKTLTLLQGLGADLRYHDPHVPALRDHDLNSASLDDADLALILTAHPQVDHQLLAQPARLLVDPQRGHTHARGHRRRAAVALAAIGCLPIHAAARLGLDRACHPRSRVTWRSWLPSRLKAESGAQSARLIRPMGEYSTPMSVVSIADLFKVGPPLTEVEQVGRAPSIDALSDRAMAGGTLRLFDQRREGKTSLALAVLARAHAAHLATCNLPLDEYPTAQSAAARILAQLGGARRAEQIGGAAARIAGRIARATGSKDLALLADLADTAQPSELALPSVLTALRERLKTSDRRAVLLIDEAHLIGDWAPEDQAAVRALLKDEHQRLGVLLASSEDSAQSTLIPILQFLGEPFVVPHIAREDWQHDLRERFKRADLSLEEPALERLLELSTGQPYCTMLLARQCAELGGAFGTVNVDVVELALPTVKRHEAWQLLRYS